MAVISKTDLENAKLDADDLASFVSDTAGTVTPRTGSTYPNIRQLVANFDAVLAEQEVEEETATAAAAVATTKAAEAASSAADLSGSLPRAGNNLKQARRIGWLYANVSNTAKLQADGKWKTTSQALDTTWRYVLSAADIASGQASIYWNAETSGIVYTVEERDASSQIVAPATVTVSGGYIARTWTLNAATTELRLRATKASGTTFVGAPSVTFGPPVTLPSDPDYYARLGEYLTANDAPLISRLVPAQNTSAVTVTGTHTATVISGQTVVYIFYSFTTPPKGDTVVLVEISSTTLAPQQLQLAPVGDQGTLGAAIDLMQVRADGPNGRYIGILPHKTAGEVPVGFRIWPNTLAGGGPNVGVSEAVTVTARAYNGASLPALRTLPSVTSKAIADQAALTLAAANAAATISIENAYKANVFRNELSSQIAYRQWLTGMAQYYFSSVSGADANAGSAMPLPKKTIQSVAASGITPGRSIMVARNESHYLGYSAFPFGTANTFIGSYGRSEKRGVLDSRKDLSGFTWTAVSDYWEAPIVLDQATVMAGVASENSCHMRVYDCRADPVGIQYDTIWTGADIAANTALLTPGTTTIFKTGSTVPDPRVNSSEQGTNYTIRMKTIDGSDPNGKAFKITQRSAPVGLAGGAIVDQVITGACAKDGAGFTPDPISGAFTEVGNCRFVGSNCHASVGPINPIGSNWFFAQYRPLGAGGVKTAASILNRSIAGGGLHIFAATDYTDRDIVIMHPQYIIGLTNAFYGHPSTVPGGYRNGYVEHLVIANSTNGVSYDSSVAAKFFTGTFTIGRLDSGPYTDPETGISYDGNDGALNISWASTVRILSGQHIGSTKTLSSSGNFLGVRAATTYHIGENGGFYYQARHQINSSAGLVVDGVTFNVNSGNYLVSRAGPLSEGTPVIHLYGVVDGTPLATGSQNPSQKATIPNIAASGGNAASYDFELNLHSAVKDRYGNAATTPTPCNIGSFFPNAGNTHFPSRLFVDADQTFGAGDRSRAQIIAWYLGAGKVQGTLANPRLAVDGVTAADFFIHPETWIVNIKGMIIDWPQSIKDALLAV